MRSNYSRGGNRGNNRGGQGRGGYQGDRQQRDGDRPQTSGGGYNNYKQNRGEGYNNYNNGGGNRFGGGDSDTSRFSESGRGGGGYRGGRGGGRGGGKPWENRDGGGGGRYQNNRDGGGGSKFHSGPAKSLQSCCNPEDSQVQKVQFHTNQYKMTIGDNAPQIFQYSVSIEGWDTKKQCMPRDIEKVITRENQKIELIFGKFISSGFNIWTTKNTDETLLIETKHMGRSITLKIDHESEYVVNTADIHNPQRQDCIAMSQILNVIVKQAMSQTGMLQFGHRPKFFDSKDPTFVDDMNMQIWKGFKATAYKYQSGCTLIIDNCARFMSTLTVLSKIDEIYDQVHPDGQGSNPDLMAAFQEACKLELVGKSIIANYGTKRTYIIDDIRFDQGPCATFFELGNGVKISVAKYFWKQYQLKITQKSQPMLVTRQQGRENFVPPEFCLLDGVPDQIRNSAPSMRALLNKVKMDPTEKLRSIDGMVDELFKQTKWAEWDIQIEREAQVLQSRKLAAPELLHNQGSDKLFANERLLKQMPVFACDDLQKGFPVVVYVWDQRGQENKKIAEKVVDTLHGCLKQLGMSKIKIGLLQINLDRRPDAKTIEAAVKQTFSSQEFHKQVPDANAKPFAIHILGHPKDYPKFKVAYTRNNIMTQMITTTTARKMNLSHASNIMKQVNTKTGGESIRVKLPELIKVDKVMVIGIDVCHAGRNSVVGFAATINPELTKYFSRFIVQKKGQELVKTDLDECMKQAVQSFAKNHDNEYPERIIIYRDGVGEGMRDQIIEKEIGQFKEVLRPLYNKITSIPPITLIVVNKRINQRMFIQGPKGSSDVRNPPPGSIIDQGLVENQQDNVCFDFFLVPQQTTQGCVTPTHFYVSLNESKDLSKSDIENLTYQFCYMYSNWSGSIKVPAPCQYAHKIADYHHVIDAGMNAKGPSLKNGFNRSVLKSIGWNENFKENLYYL